VFPFQESGAFLVSSNCTPDDLARYTWLLSPKGQDLLERIREMTAQGASDLRIAEHLRSSYPADQAALAMTQHNLRLKARDKFAHADRLFFTREGLEQATSNRIAAHRADRFACTGRVIDLCSGIGGDLMALANVSGIHHLAAVDLDPVHLLLAGANAATIAPDCEPEMILDDVREVDLSASEGVFIDPARRSTSGRFGGTGSEPPLEWALRLTDRVPAVGIKTAPGIPHELVPEGWEMETISLGPDIKEAVLWSPALASGPGTATVIAGDTVHQLRSIPGSVVPIRRPEAGQWLLDPNPAVTRAGLVEDLARLLHVAKIDEDIAFLISDSPVKTPFARSLPIIDALPWHEKRIRERLRKLDGGPVDVRRRGLAGDVEAITRRLRGKGSRRLVIAMTRVQGEPWAVICDTA
jgi:hypothetical protein